MTEDVVIRPSGLPTFQDCGRRGATRLIPEEIEAVPDRDGGPRFVLRKLGKHIGASVGTSVHAAAAYTLTEKLQNGTLGSKTEMEQRALVALDATMAEAGVLWDPAITPDKRTAQRQVTRMAHAFRNTIAPKIEPVVVEERLEADWRPGFIVSGQVDSFTREPDGIRDLKTGSRQRAHQAQYGAYSILNRAHGREVSKVFEDYIPRVREKLPQPPPVSMPIPVAVAEHAAVEALDEVVRSVTEFRRRVEEGHPHPEMAFRANPQSGLCQPKYCSAWGSQWCRHHSGAR